MLGHSGAREPLPCRPQVERLRLHKLPKTKYLQGFRSTPSLPMLVQCQVYTQLLRGSLKEAKVVSEVFKTLTVDLHIDSHFKWVATPTISDHKSLLSSEVLHSEPRLYHQLSRVPMAAQLNHLDPGCTNTALWSAVLVFTMQPICR